MICEDNIICSRGETIMTGQSNFAKLPPHSLLFTKPLLVWMETENVLYRCFIRCKKIHKVPSNPQLLTTPHFTWYQNTCKKIQESGFASSIGSNNTNTYGSPCQYIPTSTFDSLKSSLFG
ncbi:hypothetical protein OIU76_012831 [Salix suchowensis]|nr:hypothetical protein OIU76_012831 [Salix suchowensis]